MKSIGLMSGTSMDGINAALLMTDGSPHCLTELGDTVLTYAPEFKILLKAAEYSVRRAQGNMINAAKHYPQNLHHYLSQELQIDSSEIPQQIAGFSKYLSGSSQNPQPITLDAVIAHSTVLHGLAVKQLLKSTGYSAEQMDVVGYHGQTFLHQPEQKVSIIVGHGQKLADFLNIPVVNDFRSSNIAAGGSGAPLAPLYHQALAVRDKKIPVAVVNCGGIANITVINSADELDLLAFDTGPGNGLIDRLVRQRTQGREHMDADAQYGRQGKIHPEVLSALYAGSIIKNNQNYFTMPPPKSLDIGDLTLIPELEALNLFDACATLEAFTADSIVSSMQFLKGDLPKHWILAGGGWQNPVIRHELTQRLHRYFKQPVAIHTANEAGWNTEALEAQIFAFLAVRSLQGQPLSVPGATGIPYPLSGGKTHLPAISAQRKLRQCSQD